MITLIFFNLKKTISIMCDSSNNLKIGPNDYSNLTGNTSVTTISDANPNLDGSGSVTTVFTAGGKGSVIKSIIIKATQASLQGMVRLFIANADSSVISLYKEVPVATTPQAGCTPVPAPQYVMFETALEGGLKLAGDYQILASTQNAETFNIIVEGIDWNYPTSLPDTCCNFMQVNANTGVGTVSVANPNLDGSGTIVTVFTASGGSSKASVINAVTIKAMQNTHEGIIRLFISPDGSTWSLMQEVLIPETTPSAYTPSYKQVLNMDFYLAGGFTIGAATQNAESFAITVAGQALVYPRS